MSAPQYPREIAAIMITALGDRLRPPGDNFLDAFSDDAVLEFPFGGGMLPTTRGRQEIDHLFTVVPEQASVEDVVLDTYYRAADDTTILEYRSRPRIVATGARFDQRYVAVVKTRAGKITLVREYFDPTAVTGFETP